MSDKIHITSLGQGGFRFQAGHRVFYIDPYLSNQVEVLEGKDFGRLVPAWKEPHEVTDADAVFITHIHLDHCDLATLLPIASASPQCRFIGPNEVGTLLATHGICAERIVIASDAKLEIDEGIHATPVPAAHPVVERDELGYLKCIGYLFTIGGSKIYHSGDTSLAPELYSVLQQHIPIDVAILPVNERNFHREERGIIGNMSLREAFSFAQELKAKVMIPMHWDMFAPNMVFKEEIKLLYNLLQPDFELRFCQEEVGLGWTLA